jgi:hypothetical protein
MDWLSKAGFALLVVGALIFAGAVIWQLLQVFFEVPIPWYIQLGITAVILGFILMLLSAVLDRYRSVKTEEVHEKV